MMGQAKAKAAWLQVRNAAFRQGDAGALPYETAESLRTRLTGMYSKVELGTVKSIAWFVCRK